MKISLQHKAIQALLIGAGSSAVALTLWFATPVLKGWENITWGWRVKALAKPAASTEKIKVIFIDQYSLDWAAAQMSLPWPWPREVYAPILDFCRRGGAKVIAFDMLYSEPSSYMAADDIMFSEAIARSNNYVGAFFLGAQAGQAVTWPEDIPRPPLRIDGREKFPHLVEPAATFPVGEIAKAAGLLAQVKADPDEDGIFRSIAPFRVFDGSAVPLLGFGTYLRGMGDGPHELALGEAGLRIGEKVVPLDQKGRAVLRFRGPSGTHEAITAAAVIQSELKLRDGGEPVINPAEFRDAYVFLGPSAPGLKDNHGTPVSGDYPGVEIHATFLDNLLEQDFVRMSPFWWVVISTLLIAVAAAMAILYSNAVRSSILWIIVFIALPVAAGFALYAAGWWWPVIVQLFSVLLALGTGEIVNYSTEGRQKRFIKSAFKQYLSGDVIEQILENPAALKLGGEKRELTIFFSDLQGFSSFSERLTPEQLTALLNEYLTEMSDIIMEEGGTVDKYEGDAIIAFWNAPLNQADHAARACRAAIRCQRKLAERRRDYFERTGAELFMRIGIHTGDVVVGNMGSNNRFNYTVLGDAANLASRLEGANKPFGTYLMVSEVTWKQARPAGFSAREIGAVMVIGRKQPVHVFEVMGLPGEPAAEMVDAWSRMMVLCRASRWREADDIAATFSEDPLAKKYRSQFARLISGELASWDGVWKLTEK